MPSILSANEIKATGYDVANSLRFNDGSSDCLTDTMGTATNRKIFTHSFWIKRGILSSGSHHILESHADANNRFVIFIHPGDDIRFLDIDGGSVVLDIRTNAKLRDPSAWYHIVCAVDTTQSTASNRTKIYINGVLQDSFSTNTVYSEDDTPDQGTSSHVHNIGRYGGDSGYFDGYMSEVVFIDGLQLAADQFGEFDSDSGIWRPIDVSGLTFGNNGFYLEFKQSGTATNASGMGADTSGNDHHFAVSNLTAVDQSTDTCTNNALVLNPLSANSSYVFSEGNLAVAINGVNLEKKVIPSTFGSSSGKWYWEVKNTSSSNQNYIHAGFVDADVIGQFITGSQSNTPYAANNGYANFIQGQGEAGDGISVYKAGSSNYNTSTTWLADQIGMFALDLDNRKAWFGVNGTWINDASGNTGNPATGANSTWGSNDLISTDKVWIPASTGYYSGPSCSYNFGSPPYAISSGNTDGNSYGNFEYAVPSGFYTWNTKNLAEYGG